jgi:heterogeneous nuclear rnp K-like protein
MPDVDSNRKRSRSPSDCEPRGLHKRANTGTVPIPDDSTPNNSAGSAHPAVTHDVTMAEAHAAPLDNSSSTPSPKPSGSDTAAKKEESGDGHSISGDPDDTGKSSATTSGAPSSSTSAPAPSAMIHMRCLIVTQDASIIIGKGGSHVNEIREKSGARVMVSESIPGNPERILNVSGPLDAVSKVSDYK